MNFVRTIIRGTRAIFADPLMMVLGIICHQGFASARSQYFIKRKDCRVGFLPTFVDDIWHIYPCIIDH